MLLPVEQIRAKLDDRNIQEVARRSGINAWTLYQIRNGKIQEPSYRTLKKLSDYLQGGR